MTSSGEQSTARPRARSDVLRADFDDDTVLFDPVGRHLLVLNHSAALVWSCCDGSGSVDEIADDIAEAYGLAREALREQVESLVVTWRGQGLLKESC